MAEAKRRERVEQRVEQIAKLFGIPKNTAERWEDEFERVDFLMQKIENNAPKGYLQLIRRREWIPHEQDKRYKELLGPLKRWCARRSDGIVVYNKQSEVEKDRGPISGMQIPLGDGWYAGAAGEQSELEFIEYKQDSSMDIKYRIGGWPKPTYKLRQELDQKEEWVKHEARRVDPEWIELTRELNSVENRLCNIYRSYLQQASLSEANKKEKIKRLKTDFPYLRVNDDLVARAIGTSRSYSRKFIHIPETGVADREASRSQKNEVLQRDSYSCVRCGDTDDLQVHHIIPRSQGGENESENLATLCTGCHLCAHGGSLDSSETSAASWESTEYDSQEEFWNDWAAGDYSSD